MFAAVRQLRSLFEVGDWNDGQAGGAIGTLFGESEKGEVFDYGGVKFVNCAVEADPEKSVNSWFRDEKCTVQVVTA